MPTYKLTIEYEGTRYSGWQSQGNTQRTVQGLCVRAAQAVLGDADLGGAGRTDAGVHAVGQVAHLRTRKTVDPLVLMRKLNDLLPHDIHIVHVVRAADGFHARHDATQRVYVYQISRRRTAFAKSFVWWIRDPLDLVAMMSAASAVPGRHDFSAFSDKRVAEAESKIVVVDSFDLIEADDLILLRISASHFLWKMVRKLVAFLVEVGRGTVAPGLMGSMLEPGAERFQPAAPPSGLFLEAVLYGDETLARPLQPVVPVVSPLIQPRSGKKRR